MEILYDRNDLDLAMDGLKGKVDQEELLEDKRLRSIPFWKTRLTASLSPRLGSEAAREEASNEVNAFVLQNLESFDQDDVITMLVTWRGNEELYSWLNDVIGRYRRDPYVLAPPP